jgi:hypothetical protein
MLSGDGQIVEEDDSSVSKVLVGSRRTYSVVGSGDKKRQSNGTRGSSIRFEDEEINKTSSSEIIVGGSKSLNS